MKKIKYCCNCKKFKKYNEFYINRTKNDKKSLWCIQCIFIYTRVYYKKLREKCLKYYSFNTMLCLKCGFKDIRALCLDHIKNDGAKQRREIGRGNNLLQWIKQNNFPAGLQVLCANCNMIKQKEIDLNKKYRRRRT